MSHMTRAPFSRSKVNVTGKIHGLIGYIYTQTCLSLRPKHGSRCLFDLAVYYAPTPNRRGALSDAFI